VECIHAPRGSIVLNAIHPPPLAFDSDGDVGPHHVVRTVAVTATCELALARTHGSFGFERDVVLKRVLAGLPDDKARAAARRLTCVALALARIVHPAIVPLYALADPDGAPVLVLEHVDGLSLAEVLASLYARGETLPQPCAMFVAYRILSALAAAHGARDPSTGNAAPIIHGDVSAANVLVPWDGHVKLTNFDPACAGNDDDDVTEPTLGAGTAAHIAPERLTGGFATSRSDVYAASALLRVLFVGERATAYESAPLSVVCPLLHPRVADAVDRGFAAMPVDRTIGAATLAALLRSFIDVESARERLVAVLADVRTRSAAPRAALRSQPPASEVPSLPPTTMTVSPSWRPPSRRPLPGIRPTFADLDTVSAAKSGRRRTASRIAGAFVVTAAIAAFAMVVGFRSHPWAPAGGVEAVTETELPNATTAITPESAPVTSATTTPSDTASTDEAGIAATSSTGRILTEPSAAGNRLFIDGRAVGNGGVPYVVTCGRHEVRVGSAGALHDVDVPCGGDVRVRR
jgi:serine/threonine protein kinase